MALVPAESNSGFAGLPAWRQMAFMVVLAAGVAVGVAAFFWLRTPTYSVLYSNLDERDATQVMDALQQNGIPHKIDEATGALMVPAGEVHNARLKLAGEGLPEGGVAGFEQLNEEQSFGTSQFMENARYQRALEGELARTIAELRSVKDARVHLAMPKRTVFVRKQESPTASVVVHMYSGRSLDEGQVASVVHLVASSVPHLKPEDVTVVDQNGNLLSTRQSPGFGMTSTQFSYNRKLEETYTQRILGLLEPMVGNNGVRAQVSAELDFTQTEKTQETYNPDLPALRSEQISEEQMGSNGAALGVPGTLSNTPPGQQNQAQGGMTQSNSSRRSTRNYELDKTVSHTKLPTGTIRRMSIAVVVDNKQVVDDAGNVTREPWSQEELDKFTTLVKEAVGFNPQRGDSVQIINSAFQAPPEAEPLPEPSLMEQPWVWDAAKQVGGVIVVLIFFFGVLRPIMRSLADRGQQDQHAMVAAATAAAAADNQDVLAGPGGQGALPNPAQAYEEQMGTARNLVNQDPKRVAQVVKTWVNEDG